MTTKIKGLSHLNVRALGEVFPEAVAERRLNLTATTATWAHLSPADIIQALDSRMAELPTRGHPRASLHAVLRKARRLNEAHAKYGHGVITKDGEIR